ncbi:DddA-like double-stranded DNA deaminase toxin [Saccharothrix obliqua]|uniref:DddA-like double-stranded DNA deaminase toxin n=1 Tax=Saccharothrix obliqua TaxID=2861747 RepID=UPI001C5FACAB|nr:DddA-like double-stranded DNA deaminase toxin [Saccharothrix obliqua]MBW4718687.1 hypothetical protein [Saccharothrix obliqua]
MSRVARLGAVERKADEAVAVLWQAEQLWVEAYAGLARALHGSTRHDLAAEWTAVGGVAPEDAFTALQGVFVAWRQALDVLADRLREPAAVPSPAGHTPVRRDPSPPRRSAETAADVPVPGGNSDGHVIARDGSRYPAQARWAVEDLPRRVARGNEGEKTVGRVRVGAVDQGVMTSGRDGTWTPAVDARMAQLGIATPLRLGRHVEMKVAHLLVDTPATHAEVVINHQTCGSPGFVLGAAACYQVLPRYLPQGKVLTVYGTTANGEPFVRTYEGQA